MVVEHQLPEERHSKKPKDVVVPPQVFALIQAAIAWSRFQEADSLKDQETDLALRTEASTAKDRLLAAIERL